VRRCQLDLRPLLLRGELPLKFADAFGGLSSCGVCGAAARLAGQARVVVAPVVVETAGTLSRLLLQG
jgi:hypothetical protein